MSQWGPGPLRHWLAINDSGVWGEDPTGKGDVPVIRSTEIRLDGSWDLSEVATRSLASAEVQSKRLLQGDLVVVKSSGSPEHLGKTAIVTPVVAAMRPCFANFVQRLRACSWADPRYLWYLLNSRSATSELEVLGNTTTGLRNLNGSIIGSVTFPGPSLIEQRAIADFLDAETAYIDALIAKKQLMATLLRERASVTLDEALRRRGVPQMDESRHRVRLPDGWVALNLGRVLRQLTNGYVGPTRDILVDDGIRYIQGTHIKNGRIEFARRPFYVSPEWHLRRPRISLKQGDLVIVQTGDIGQVAVVPANFGEASCHALLIARPNTDIVSSDYLGLYLQSSFGRQQLLRLATGALHPHLEFGIREAMVVVPPPAEQPVIIDEVRDAVVVTERLQVHIADEVRLLRERRLALITAAVNGEIAVPGAAA
jgi:type I restriction enzyme, S subunit